MDPMGRSVQSTDAEQGSSASPVVAAGDERTG
jgi:hypothetical protein